MDRAFITMRAKEILLEAGSLRPVVFAQFSGNDALYMLPFASFPFDSTGERERGLFAAGRRFAQKMKRQLKGKKPVDLAFACEGWGVEMKREEYDPRVSPSKHPSRREVLFITHLACNTMKQDITVFEMLRQGGTLDLAPTDAYDEVRSSLLPAFLCGIETAGQESSMAKARLRRVCEEYSASATREV